MPSTNENLLLSDNVVGDDDSAGGSDEEVQEDAPRNETRDVSVEPETPTSGLRKSGRKTAGQNGITAQRALIEEKISGSATRKRSLEPDNVDQERLDAIVSFEFYGEPLSLNAYTSGKEAKAVDKYNFSTTQKYDGSGDKRFCEQLSKSYSYSSRPHLISTVVCERNFRSGKSSSFDHSGRK